MQRGQLGRACRPRRWEHRRDEPGKGTGWSSRWIRTWHTAGGLKQAGVKRQLVDTCNHTVFFFSFFLFFHGFQFGCESCFRPPRGLLRIGRWKELACRDPTASLLFDRLSRINWPFVRCTGVLIVAFVLSALFSRFGCVSFPRGVQL